MTAESSPRLDCQRALAVASGLPVPVAPGSVGLIAAGLLLAAARGLRRRG